MRNIKLVMEYDGSRYDGWQKQPKNPKSITIQDKIETVLSKMEGESIELIGAAKTEAGVHAYGQVANFKTNSTLKLYEIKHYLNRFLPRDIAILEVQEVPERFHSTFLASSFKYEYKITTSQVPSVFQRKYIYHSFRSLNVAKMKEGAKYLIGKHDFRAFSDNKKMKKSTERELFDVAIYSDINELSITLHGDDFWPYMARMIVGTLIEVGGENIPPQAVKEILESMQPGKAAPPAEAQGLFLQEVLYR